jgi:hypothetical protein
MDVVKNINLNPDGKRIYEPTKLGTDVFNSQADSQPIELHEQVIQDARRMES